MVSEGIRSAPVTPASGCAIGSVDQLRDGASNAQSSPTSKTLDQVGLLISVGDKIVNTKLSTISL